MTKKLEKLEKLDKLKKLEEPEQKSQTSPCAVWDFRANEDLFTSQALLEFFKKNAKKYVFQKEKGDTGYIHYQGRFSLIKKRNKSDLMTMFKTIGVPNYLMPTCKENHAELFFYALKEDTRIGELHMDSKHASLFSELGGYKPIQYRDKVLYPYQQSILDTAEVSDFRSINIIVDKDGFNGKSTIAAIAELYHGGIDMPVLNNSQELVSLLCNICMDTNNRAPKLVFFDMPRCMSKKSLIEFYTAIEQIKKGKLYDLRYHYKSFWIDSPCIWVFSNEYPDTTLLSKDRWRIWSISQDKELIPYANIDILCDFASSDTSSIREINNY